jgi:hypothetical protein
MSSTNFLRLVVVMRALYMLGFGVPCYKFLCNSQYNECVFIDIVV